MRKAFVGIILMFFTSGKRSTFPALHARLSVSVCMSAITGIGRIKTFAGRQLPGKRIGGIPNSELGYLTVTAWHGNNVKKQA